MGVTPMAGWTAACKSPMLGFMTSEELRAALKELGISQRQLAREINMDPSSVNRWAMETAEIPGAAVAYIRLKLDIKRAMDRTGKWA